jgi:ribonuclease D
VLTNEVAYELVDTESAWKQCLKKLSKVSRMAVDIEANSLYAYREQVCLIQISTDTDNFILDPLSGVSLEALGNLLNHPGIEKVFHAADYDLALLKSLNRWNVSNLFDTMWAGRLLGFKKMGLAWFLETLYGIHLDKKHQKANWGQRPLTEEKLIYACNDTRYLLRMRDDLGRDLAQKGLEAEAREIFTDLCRSRVFKRSFDPEGFWKLPGARTLPPQARSVLRALFVFRDNEAKRRNVPPFKVLNNQMLIHLALASMKWNGKAPSKPYTVPGVPEKLLNRLNPALFEIMHKALNGPPPVFPSKVPQHSSGYWQRHELLMEWRKETAVKRDVESDVILSRETLEELAEKNPLRHEDLEQIATLGDWHKKQYGADILKILNQ